MAGIADVVQDCRSALLAGIVHNNIAKAEESLRNAGRYSDVLNLAEGNVARRSGNQAGVDLNLRVGQGVTHHVSPEVIIGWNQKEQERQRYRDISGNGYQRQ